MKILYKVKVSEAIKLDCIGEDNLNLKQNDWCIIKCNRYEDYGRLTYLGEIPEGLEANDCPIVKRRATLVDQSKANENSARCKSFHRKAQEAIQRHDLPMRLNSTHYAFDRTLIIYQFTAPGRVDFRELVKDLTNMFKMRVELRQIGPRDAAGLVGGLGSCGRALCCSTFLTNFVSINLKMAKEQGVSLNPSTIVGACGRLKCCLQYEYEGYRVLMEKMPRTGVRCNCEGCDGSVIESNPLNQTVKVALRDGDNSRVVTVPLEDVKLN